VRILVVDDDADTVEALADILTLDGHEVVVAGTVEDALAAARSTQPDLVLLDINLGASGTGIAVARGIRSDPVTARARIVAVTGATWPAVQQRALAAGVDEVLSKPFTVAEIDAVLGRASRD
jgi:CheY-like chemotaxis protein